jgi:hypothetical protein
MILLLKVVAVVYFAAMAGVTAFQRKLLYLPGHRDVATQLQEWKIDGQPAGYAREVKNPKNIWLMLHGNAGQAANRDYVLPCLSPDDSLYVMEYPGYGRRPGAPARAAIDQAARAAYASLRANHPDVPVCVLGESIGSGAASSLAAVPKPPDKIVLVVPFDQLASVVAGHMPLLPAGWLLFDRWDNVAALKSYRGKVEIFGATMEEVIPIQHARNLAASVPQAVFHEIPGGHNDWSATGTVVIRN